MCGIIAITTSKAIPDFIERGLAAINHRGPDDQGIFVSDDGNCHLGHVRLSIIDISSAGHQPMTDSSGRFVISYNGEVYNYLELKKSLEKNHGPINWKSTSDTEVILEGFLRQGVKFLSRLNGIFALAIYDIHDKIVHVLRDPLGIKPLFVTEQKSGVFFCSELKGLLAIPDLHRTLRHQSLADQLAFMYVPEPYTRYKEFKKVQPGVCNTYFEGKKVSSVKLFGHLDEHISFSNTNDMVDCFYSAFSSAVKRQLMSDVPVSLMLSGGLDSSAIAYEVLNSGASIRDAYTISFSNEDRIYDQQGDDLYYARIIAKQFGLNLQVIPAKQDFMSLLPELNIFLEDGISDPAAINTYLICESARSRGIKVMLTGQGADEFLGGYRRYLAENMIGWMPAPLQFVSKIISNLLSDNITGRFNATNRRLKRLLTLASQKRMKRLLGMYTWESPVRITNLFNQTNRIEIGKEFSILFDNYKNLDTVDAMMRVDQKYDLMSLNLSYSDRMSMAVGVEARVPYLDFDLVRIMNSIPSKVKIKHGISKYVLKKAMEPPLPHEIVYREKAGFTLPIRAWMRKENEMLRYYFDSDRIRRQGIFNPNSLQNMCDVQFSGKRDHASTLFSMLCIQVWLDSQDSFVSL